MRLQIILSALIVTAFGITVNCSAQTKRDPAAKRVPTTYGKMVQAGNLSQARASHTATLLNDGKVLIAGGMERNGVFFDSADIFDPSTERFAPAAYRMTRKRVSHTATRLLDGRVLIAGGWSDRERPEADSEIFDPSTKIFNPTGNMSRRRAGHTETLLNSGKVLIAGGFDGGQNLGDAEIFDSATGTFTPAGKMQSARLSHTATKLPDGRILLAGGELGRGQILSTAEIFDPKTNSFISTKDNMSVVRYKHDAILLSDGRVLIFGGSDSRDWRGQYKSAEVFDPKTSKFTPVGEMNFARFKIEGTTVLLSDGKVFIGGGNEKAEIFDPRTKVFTVAGGNLGIPIHFASVTLLSDGRALVVGGYGNGTRADGPVSTNKAWLFKL